ALLLHSILSDTSGVEQNRRAVSEAERRIDVLFGELLLLVDSARDRQLIQNLQARAVAVRPLSEEVMQLIRKQQMNDALKLVSERLLPAYDDLQRSAQSFLSSERNRMNSEILEVLARSSATRIVAFVFVFLTIGCSLLISLVVHQMNRGLGGMGSQVSDG